MRTGLARSTTSLLLYLLMTVVLGMDCTEAAELAFLKVRTSRVDCRLSTDHTSAIRQRGLSIIRYKNMFIYNGTKKIPYC